MWFEHCHKPPMTGNGKHTTYKNGDDWGMVYCCFTHINYEKRITRSLIYYLISDNNILMDDSLIIFVRTLWSPHIAMEAMAYL